MAYLEVAHIIPHSLMSLTNEEGERRLVSRCTRFLSSLANIIQISSKQMAYQILKMFKPGSINLMNGIDIDRPINALTFTHNLRRLFGNFQIAFEPVGFRSHTYKIVYLETDRMGRVEQLPVAVTLFLTPDRSIDPPSPQLLKIHSVIGRILHLSDAGDYIDQLIRDLELEGGGTAQTGSTGLDDFVRLRLGDMPFSTH